MSNKPSPFKWGGGGVIADGGVTCPIDFLLLTPPSRATAPPPHLNGEGCLSGEQDGCRPPSGKSGRRRKAIGRLPYGDRLGEQPFGTKAIGDPGGRCRRLQPAGGHRRGRDDRAAQGAPRRSVRPQDRRASRTPREN